MIAASQTPIPPASIATRKMKNFAQKPPVGGIPASDTMKTVIATASAGAARAIPAKSEIRMPGRSRAAPITTANAPRFMTP